MARNIFYAWQATLPNSVNRGFIYRALTDACVVVASDLSIDERPQVDHDTRGVPGAPDIAKVIRSKIDISEAFVADVSIVHPGDDPAPNANVLYETGYAEKSLECDRILLVMNVEYGVPERLPFDIRSRRVITYRAASGADNAAERKRLQRVFEASVRALLLQSPKPVAESMNALKVVLTEAERMRDHARDLNIELHHGRSRQYLPLRFRTSQLEAAVPHVVDVLRRDEALRRDLTTLRSTAAAADEETDRLLARGGDGRQLRQLVININHAAAGVVRTLGPILSAN